VLYIQGAGTLPTTQDELDDPGVSNYFVEALEDAEHLLKFAAETGVDIDDATRSAVLHARAVPPAQWTEDMSARLLVALTGLAAKLKPVTAESLKAYRSENSPTMRTYLWVAVFLAVIIIPSSILTFVTSNISNQVKTDITTANALVVKLHANLGPPSRQDVGTSDEIADLQDYAATVRAIYARARRLNHLILPHVDIPPPLRCDSGNKTVDAECVKKKFELPYKLDDLPAARDTITDTYQDVRYFAQSIGNHSQ